MTVLIWDVDETLVLFQSLLDGSFAQASACRCPSHQADPCCTNHSKGSSLRCALTSIR